MLLKNILSVLINTWIVRKLENVELILEHAFPRNVLKHIGFEINVFICICCFSGGVKLVKIKMWSHLKNASTGYWKWENVFIFKTMLDNFTDGEGILKSLYETHYWIY